MKTYVNDANQNVITASTVLDGSALYLSSAGNPDLPVGTVVLEKDNPDSPHLQIITGSTQSTGGSWFTPVEPIMREYFVKYSFITITHSTIAGSMPQRATTKAEAISQARAWLIQIYQPVEFDYVTI